MGDASKLIQDERILDNIMVPVFFEPGSDGAKAALEKILQVIIKDPALKVQAYNVEHPLYNVRQHSVRIDVLATDRKGRLIALELQKDTRGGLLQRAVYEAATIAIQSLREGKSYEELPKIYVIFVTEKDFLGDGEPTYESFTTFTNGNYTLDDVAPTFIFVNGAYDNIESELGRVIHDIVERDPQNMLVPELKERAVMLKTTKIGREKMSAALEAFAAQNKAEGIVSAGRRFGADEPSILSALMAELSVSKEKAADFLRQYSDSSAAKAAGQTVL